MLPALLLAMALSAPQLQNPGFGASDLWLASARMTRRF